MDNSIESKRDAVFNAMMPIIRNVMPNIIAQQLIGVQPMSPPKIFRNSLYGRPIDDYKKKMTKEHYKVFLRLNDRKKYQKHEDFVKAKYPHAIWKMGNGYATIEQWCLEQYGTYNFVMLSNYRVFFENEEDRLLFILRWS